MLKEVFIKLGQLREARGWSQYDIADRTGIHQSQIGSIEAGEMASIKRLDRFLKMYCKAFGLSIDDLFGLNDSLSHLSRDIQNFIKDPANADKLKRLWLEEELRKVSQ